MVWQSNCRYNIYKNHSYFIIKRSTYNKCFFTSTNCQCRIVCAWAWIVFWANNDSAMTSLVKLTSLLKSWPKCGRDTSLEWNHIHQYYRLRFSLNHASNTNYLAYFLKKIVNVHSYVNVCLTILVLWLTSPNNSQFIKFKFLLSCASKRL